MVTSFEGPGTKNDCAGELHQQFTQPIDWNGRSGLKKLFQHEGEGGKLERNDGRMNEQKG
jgi:hypothetical protein